MKDNLCIIYYHNPSDELRGKTRRYLYELHPNVFSGVISVMVRDNLWNLIMEQNAEAVLIYPAKNEQGFSYKSTPNAGKQLFAEFNGLYFPARVQEKITVSDMYAKPDKKLLDHMEEVGYISEALLKYGRGKRAIDVLAGKFGISEEELISSISFLCASHDIGKAHPGFLQSMAETKAEFSDKILKLILNGSITADDEHIRHERYSREIVEEYLISRGFNKYFSKDIAYILAFHHQGKTSGSKINVPVEKVGPTDIRWDDWKSVQVQILDKIEEKWNFSSKMKDIYGHSGINGLTYFILSVMVNADWIASSSAWKKRLDNGLFVKETAGDFIKNNELIYRPVRDVFKDATWEKVFSYKPNGLQNCILNDINSCGSLLLIEYPCGHGKTEAAVSAVVKHCGDCGGAMFVTPTMQTAHAMAGRIRELFVKLDIPMNLPEFDSSMIWNDNEMENIPKDMWPGRSRHQMLYPFAVGTVDQVLKTVLSYRYSCIGTLGLSDKVIIIDEIHAYDAYMLTEIESLIKWCCFFKVPVILLSATLPTKTKERLFKAAGCKSPMIDNGYPLISVVKKDNLVQLKPSVESPVMPVKAEKVLDMTEYMISKAMGLKEGIMALIAPTVDDAFDIYHTLQGKLASDELVLYVGRNTVNNKTEIGNKLVKLLGKDRKNRPKKMIVVATSIIEQSLDIDFDYMYTSLAPIDLLIQRLGRVWRHSDKGTIRELNPVLEPFVVLIPEKYGSLKYIYDEGILDATRDIMSGLTKIDTVKDVRRLIDEVYETPVSKDRISEINAGRNCLTHPESDEVCILSGTDTCYNSFNNIQPQTREETYPTQQIIILEQLKSDYDYDEIRNIMQNNMVSVSLNKLKGFTETDNNIEAFKNAKVYVGKGLSVSGSGKTMTLKKEGLEFV